MIITKITLSEHKIPLKHPFITALRRVEAVAFVRIHIHTDTQNIGIGEAPPTKAITGETLESISKSIRHTITPKLLGLSPQEALEVLKELSHNSASAAVDMALFDLCAQDSNQTLRAYLGAETSTLKTAITLSLNTPELMAKQAKEALKSGLDILKVKVGGSDGKDIERIHAISTIAPHATILLDANQAWSRPEALRIIESIQNLNIALIEQPVAANDLTAMAEITRMSKIPILADESAFNLKELKKVIAMNAADMINIKLMKCGGISPAREILAYAQEHKIRCMMGSMLEGPHSIMAAASLAMAFPETITYIDLDSPLLYEDITLAHPLKFHKNELSL